MLGVATILGIHRWMRSGAGGVSCWVASLGFCRIESGCIRRRGPESDNPANATPFACSALRWWGYGANLALTRAVSAPTNRLRPILGVGGEVAEKLTASGCRIGGCRASPIRSQPLSVPSRTEIWSWQRLDGTEPYTKPHNYQYWATSGVDALPAGSAQNDRY